MLNWRRISRSSAVLGGNTAPTARESTAPCWPQNAEDVVLGPAAQILVFFYDPLHNTVAPDPQFRIISVISLTMLDDLLGQITAAISCTMILTHTRI